MKRRWPSQWCNIVATRLDALHPLVDNKMPNGIQHLSFSIPDLASHSNPWDLWYKLDVKALQLSKMRQPHLHVFVISQLKKNVPHQKSECHMFSKAGGLPEWVSDGYLSNDKWPTFSAPSVNSLLLTSLFNHIPSPLLWPHKTFAKPSLQRAGSKNLSWTFLLALRGTYLLLRMWVCYLDYVSETN